MRRGSVLFLLGVLLALALTLSVVTWLAAPEAGPAGDVDPAVGAGPADLAAVEVPTEAFANALLDCSMALRSGDDALLAGCFAETLQGTPFPQRAGPVRDTFRWVGAHDWHLDAARGVARDEMLASAESFMDQVYAYAANFVPPRAASRAVGRIKRAVCSGVEVPFSEGLAIERELQQLLFQGEDAKEGLAAYIEKRAPEFSGC